MKSNSRRADEGGVDEEVRRITGVLNPIACLHLGDVVLFTVDRHHYPEYDLYVRHQSALHCRDSGVCLALHLL